MPRLDEKGNEKDYYLRFGHNVNVLNNLERQVLFPALDTQMSLHYMDQDDNYEHRTSRWPYGWLHLLGKVALLHPS